MTNIAVVTYRLLLSRRLLSFLEMGSVSTSSARGYICPLGQICKEQDKNPRGGLQNWDGIWGAMVQVVIISSVNTVSLGRLPLIFWWLTRVLQWAPVMYTSIDAEFFVSCAFYLTGVVLLNFWLINLFVAVITSTFSSIRRETKKSAFGANTCVTSVLSLSSMCGIDCG